MLFIARALYRKTSKCEYYFIYFIIVEIRNEGAAPDVGSYLPRLLLLLRNLLLLLLLLSAHLTKCELNICSLSLFRAWWWLLQSYVHTQLHCGWTDQPEMDIGRLFECLHYSVKRNIFFLFFFFYFFSLYSVCIDWPTVHTGGYRHSYRQPLRACLQCVSILFARVEKKERKKMVSFALIISLVKQSARHRGSSLYPNPLARSSTGLQINNNNKKILKYAPSFVLFWLLRIGSTIGELK